MRIYANRCVTDEIAEMFSIETQFFNSNQSTYLDIILPMVGLSRLQSRRNRNFNEMYKDLIYYYIDWNAFYREVPRMLVVQWVRNASQSREGNAASRVASGSSW